MATTQTTAYTLGSLRCGSSFQVGVDSFNASGVRSSIVSVAGRTTACPGTPVGNDTSPPTSPVSLIQGATTATSFSLLWAASQDNVGVAGYELFLNGNKIGTTTATSYTFPNLSCGTSYTLAVDAFDAAGNRSQSAVVQASTSPCPDTSPPTVPALPTQTGSTATSISLLWSASLDNVGVAGYELFLNGNKIGTTTATSYTFPNLSCGTSYALAVDAFDTVGNRSQRSSLNGTTSTCASAVPPPPPNNCTATLAVGGNVSAFFNGLAPGAVGCLHGGNYGSVSTAINLTASGTASAPITLQNYPGETATVQGAFTLTGSWDVIKGLKMNLKNNILSNGDCGPRGFGFMDLAANNVLEHNELYESDQSQMGGGLYISGSNTEVRFNKIHDVGSCQSFDHGIYVGHGSGTHIHHNWIWNAHYGWGVQIYPDASGTRIYSNVIDSAEAGFVICSTGSDNDAYNNVVTNSVGGGNTGSGSLVSGCGPQGSSTGNDVHDNDQWQNPGGSGNCTTGSPGMTCSANVSVNPLYADGASHNYQVLPTSPVLSWSLWSGS